MYEWTTMHIHWLPDIENDTTECDRTLSGIDIFCPMLLRVPADADLRLHRGRCAYNFYVNGF